MLYFVLEVIIVSIFVSAFATWIKLIPRYSKKKYYLIRGFVHSALLTVFMTLVFALGVYPSWVLTFAIILLILWLSVRLTNNIVQNAGESEVDSSKVETNKQETPPR